jgi:hypothetical protein
MAGSLRAMLYTTDIVEGGERKSIVLKLDESNAKLGGGVEATPANIAAGVLAVATDYQRLVPRYMLLEGVTTGGKPVRRKVAVCDPANVLFNEGGTTVMGVMVGNSSEAVTMTVTGTVGETRTFFKTVDTGLDDGSAT